MALWNKRGGKSWSPFQDCVKGRKPALFESSLRKRESFILSLGPLRLPPEIRAHVLFKDPKALYKRSST